MKTLLAILFSVMPIFLFSQNLDGSWVLTHINGHELKDQEVVKIFQDGYFAFGAKEPSSNAFINAGGGEYSFNEKLIEIYDFHNDDPDRVGDKKHYAVQMERDRMILTNEDGSTETWTRKSDHHDALSGNWVITGRKRGGELRTSEPGARRTIKILGGGRFQWAAFNSETGEFFGSGGGTYTAQDGQYQENIAFFSRDNSRVGAKLRFRYEIKDGEWHHSGKSSKGDAIYEIWSPYHIAYKR